MGAEEGRLGHTEADIFAAAWRLPQAGTDPGTTVQTNLSNHPWHRSPMAWRPAHIIPTTWQDPDKTGKRYRRYQTLSTAH